MQQVNALRKQIESAAFDIFCRRGQNCGDALKDWHQAECQLFQSIPFNLADKNDYLELRAEVPGFTEREIDLQADSHSVLITGKRSHPDERRLFTHIVMPAEIQSDTIYAMLDKGILILTIHKAVHHDPTSNAVD